MVNLWSSLDSKTKADTVKKIMSTSLQIAAGIAAFGVGKKVDAHYGASKKEVISEEPEEAPKKGFFRKK